MQRLLGALTGLTAACLLIAGCGSSVSSSGAGGAAQRFVAAVSSGDRTQWCHQLGSPLFSATPQGPLQGAALTDCIQSDIFLATASCDIEAAIAQSSVSAVSSHGSSAEARLSSGAAVDLRSVNGTWLVVNITGAGSAHHAHLSSGPCAGA